MSPRPPLKKTQQPRENSKRAKSEVRVGRNEVSLEGAVSSSPVTKTLPSGDEVVEFRIVIDRLRSNKPIQSRRLVTDEADEEDSGEVKTRKARREVDSLEIAAWRSRERRMALKLQPGDWVSIQGSVHRRFWTSPRGLASRWQIEAELLKKI